ncbi:MAG: TA system VapC family ribonuclease toxin [Vicinamibacterales bacterium]
MPTGVGLLDVNVLVALFDPDHVHHEMAHGWFAENREHGWATCPVTENGFLRVLASPAYGSPVARPAELLQRLQRFCASGNHHFWGDTVSLRDATVFNAVYAASHRQLDGVYLLGLAAKMGGRLVTFEQQIPFKAIVGGGADSLVVISTGG